MIVKNMYNQRYSYVTKTSFDSLTLDLHDKINNISVYRWSWHFEQFDNIADKTTPASLCLSFEDITDLCQVMLELEQIGEPPLD